MPATVAAHQLTELSELNLQEVVANRWVTLAWMAGLKNGL